MTETLGKWLSRCEFALLYLGVLATFAMMCLTSADALSRYLFNSPILGALEITEKYLMVASIFLACPTGCGADCSSALGVWSRRCLARRGLPPVISPTCAG